jgi:hypothetical protein
MKTVHVLKLLTGAGGDRPDSWFDPVQLRIGTDIEMEHTHRRDIAKIICKQHLTEHKLYYKYLLEMEAELKRIEEIERSYNR